MESDSAWKQWGEKDPYYGVLSDSRFRKSNLVENIETFTRSGRTYWETILATCAKLYGDFKKERAADFGCGVARVLAPMAGTFEKTVGIDISPHMLKEARKNAPSSELILSDDRLSKLTGKLDFVHSFIVLQHIPPKRGLRFVSILLQHLNPGGIAALHVTLKRPHPVIKRTIYFLKHRVPGARFLFNILQGKTLLEPVMQMNEYDLADLLATFEACKMSEIFIIPQPTGDCFGVIVFGRKSPP